MGSALKFAALALCLHLVATQSSFNPTILQDSRDEPKVDGTFGFLYRTEDGIAHAAKGDSNGVIHGRFSYTDPTGFKLNYNYNAGSRVTPGYNYDAAPEAPSAPAAPAPAPAPRQYEAPQYTQARQPQQYRQPPQEYRQPAFRPQSRYRPQAQPQPQPEEYRPPFRPEYRQPEPQPEYQPRTRPPYARRNEVYDDY